MGSSEERKPPPTPRRSHSCAVASHAGRHSQSLSWPPRERSGRRSTRGTPGRRNSSWDPSSCHSQCSVGSKLMNEVIFDVAASSERCEAIIARMDDSGSIGNAVTIFVILRTRRLYNPCTPFLVNISVADLSTTLLILPVLGFNALAGFYLIPYPVCKFFSISFHTGMGNAPNCLLATLAK